MEPNPPLLFWDVDTQVDFMKEAGELYVPDAESLLPNLAQLSDLARRQGIPVIASADDHELTDAEISLEADFETTYPPHCMRGTAGAERVPETAFQQGEAAEIGHRALSESELEERLAAARHGVLIKKKQVDVFANPNAGPLVRRLNPGEVVVYGVALDVCNRCAVEGLLARGFTDVTVVVDATRAIRAEKGEELLAGWRRRGVRLATTEEVVRQVEGRP